MSYHASVQYVYPGFDVPSEEDDFDTEAEADAYVADKITAFASILEANTLWLTPQGEGVTRWHLPPRAILRIGTSVQENFEE